MTQRYLLKSNKTHNEIMKQTKELLNSCKFNKPKTHQTSSCHTAV